MDSVVHGYTDGSEVWQYGSILTITLNPVLGYSCYSRLHVSVTIAHKVTDQTTPYRTHITHLPFNFFGIFLAQSSGL